MARVSFLDKLFFTKHLAVMIKSGIPLAEVLSIFQDQTKNKTFQKVLKQILADVVNGQPLNVSLKKFPKIFDQFYTSLIEIGEESGTLEKSLDFIAKQLAKDYSLRQKIKAAMLYPGLVFLAATIMGGFISFFILPKLVDFFEAFEIELPWPTRVLLFFALMIKNYGLLIFLGSTGVITAFLTLIRTKAIKPLWHQFQLKIPLFGNLIAYGQLARFSRNFGIMVKSGVPINSALETTANTLSNLRFQRDLLLTNKALVKGKTISGALTEYKFPEFPPLVVKMIGVGEKTGKLEQTLLYLGDFYEVEIDHISKNMTTILEPVLLVTIGLVVGFVALAIISPIYELTGSIRQ